MSRKRNPVEKNRRLGNPGKRPIPEPAAVVAGAVSPRTGIPEPLFPLGRRGRYVWDHVLAYAADWIADTDLPMMQRLCELEDDAAALRFQVLEAPHRHNTWRDRAQLLALSTELRRTYSEFGLTPAERARLGVAQVHAAADMTRAAAVANRAKTYAMPPTGSARPTTAPAPGEPQPLPTRQLALEIATEPPRPRDRLGRFVASTG